MNQTARTRLVVAFLAMLYMLSWTMSLANLFGIHFWDAKYARHRIEEAPHDFYNTTTFGEIGSSYYSPPRYVWFLPHVLGAVVWWNLYFLQLVPKIRRAFGYKLHRILGRCLLAAALLQTISGVGLALTSHSNVIKLISLVLALAVLYSIIKAWEHAVRREIAFYKFWVLRMVGYLQTIALQRFWLLLLISSHEMGWYGLYPDMSLITQQQANVVVLSMFDDSFILAILTAFVGTEWYLSGLQGMLEVKKVEPIGQPQPIGQPLNQKNAPVNEHSSLLPDSTTRD